MGVVWRWREQGGVEARQSKLEETRDLAIAHFTAPTTPATCVRRAKFYSSVGVSKIKHDVFTFCV
jgi:hypothetical protein